MSATVCRAQAMRASHNPHAGEAAEMADVFCRTMRRRIALRFAGLRSNDDVMKYKTARRILDGDHLWLERGLVPSGELEKLAAAPHQPPEVKELVTAETGRD